MRTNKNAASVTGSSVRTLKYFKTGTYTDICEQRKYAALLCILSGFSSHVNRFWMDGPVVVWWVKKKHVDVLAYTPDDLINSLWVA